MIRKTHPYKSIGQSTVEYAVLLAIVASALIAMQIYLKRGVQGRIRDLAAQLAPAATGPGAAQYEKGRTTANYQTHQDSTVHQWVAADMSSHTQIDNDVTTRTGSENVLPDTQ